LLTAASLSNSFDRSYSFNILDHDVLKSYNHLTNVIFTIHGTGDRSSSLLLNSHIDSQLPGFASFSQFFTPILGKLITMYYLVSSPGAADDAIGVGIMIEIAQILIERDQPFNHSLVLVRPFFPS
jgi:Zn-dependent M28 family amino/carboxypeptidase